MEQKKDKLWIKWIHSYYIKDQNREELRIPNQACWMVRKVLGAKEHLHLLHNGATGKKSMIRQAYITMLGSLPKVEWGGIMCHNSARPKAIFTSWLHIQDILLTANRRLRWRIQVDPICAMCKQEDETRDHLFSECLFAKALWMRLMCWLNIQQPPHFTWLSMQQWILQDTKGKS